MIISIDGNIAAGKTCILDNLELVNENLRHPTPRDDSDDSSPARVLERVLELEYDGWRGNETW